MNTPPPLPPNQPPQQNATPPPLPKSEPVAVSMPNPEPIVTPRPRHRAIKFIAGALGVLALIILIAGITLAMNCPDEAQLRKSLYGEMEPRYKLILETVGRASKLAGGPCILYHNHFVYSTLDFRML